MKRYSNHPNGKRPPFEFELGDDDDGSVQKFVCTGRPQLLDLMGFAKFAEADVSDPTAALALTDLFEKTMGADTYAEFMTYCRTWDTDPEVQLQILSDMISYTLAGRNLAGRSPSADGRSSTETGSRDGLLSAEDISRWQEAGRTAVEAAATSPAPPQSMPVFTAPTPGPYQTALEALRTSRAGAGNPLGLNGTPGASGTP